MSDRLSRSARTSHAILPLHSSRRLTDSGSVTSGSSSTEANRPEVNSETGLTAARSRSIDFGVNTTSGRLIPSSACRRSRWK